MAGYGGNEIGYIPLITAKQTLFIPAISLTLNKEVAATSGTTLQLPDRHLSLPMIRLPSGNLFRILASFLTLLAHDLFNLYAGYLPNCTWLFPA